jgi:hypothetical protein
LPVELTSSIVVTAAVLLFIGGIVEKERPVFLSFALGVKLPGFIPLYL